MTCLEKVKVEHPEKINDKRYGGVEGCPWSYGYSDVRPGCRQGFKLCRECWNREAKGEKV